VLNLTTYFFIEISFLAMIPTIVRSVAKANHPILSNWLKQATRHLLGFAAYPQALRRTETMFFR
jgi:hypothetical protein